HEMKVLMALAIIGMAGLIGLLQAQTNQPQHLSGTPAEVAQEFNGKPGTVEGYLRDTACLFRVPTVTKAENRCMEMCLKNGAPLGIIAKDGTLYHPISKSLPDVSVREGLLPYAGKYVRAQGRLFERGGSHAIAIEHLEVVPEEAGK